MGEPTTFLEHGTLWDRLRHASQHAQGCGAQLPIETQQTQIRDQGIDFVVRVVSSLARKENTRPHGRPRDPGQAPDNPFLPYERDLFVADISASHLCLLNKYNVIENHLLIVTRNFEPQEYLLSLADFEALCLCMAEYPCLGFYNGGQVAGASQPHKHLQTVPLPLGESGPPVPIEPALGVSMPGEHTKREPEPLPFVHAVSPMVTDLADQPMAAARECHDHYHRMLRACGIEATEHNGHKRQSAPYNLLVTRRWMLLVPRSREHFESISINALAFAGSLFVRDRPQLRRIQDAGPMAVLRAVGIEGEHVTDSMHPD